MNQKGKAAINKPVISRTSNQDTHKKPIFNQVMALIIAIASVWIIFTGEHSNYLYSSKESSTDLTELSLSEPEDKASETIDTYSHSVKTNAISSVRDLGGNAYYLTYKNQDYYIVKIKPNKNLQLFWKKDRNVKLKTITSLNDFLHKKNKELIFAINGGIFSKEYEPLGFYKENGKKLIDLSEATSGYGNFYMQPNGVFAFSNNGAIVQTTQDFKKSPAANNYINAIQSGPMLLINNSINPNFDPNSNNRYIRNAVGVTNSNEIVFVISNTNVNFHEIADLFKSQLNCSNALYLDGAISKIYLPELGITDFEGEFGSFIAIVSN